MATRNTSATFLNLTQTLLLPTQIAALTADQIILAEVPATGTASGEDLYTVINKKLEESNIVGLGTTTPQATEAQPWIWIRTDGTARFFLKKRTGMGQNDYTWQGPFFEGSYESRIILSAQDNPAIPNITWNAANRTFNISGGDWSLNTPSAKWWRLVVLANTGTTRYISPLIRIGDPSAEDISYTNSAHTAVNNVKEGLDIALLRTATATTGDSEDQIGEFTSGWVYSHPLSGLSANGYTGYHSFSVNSSLRNLERTYGTTLSIAASAALETQSGSIGSITLEFGVASNANSFFFSEQVTIDSNNARTSGHVRAFGNLPQGFNTGRFLVRVVRTSGTPVDVAAFFTSIKFRIEPDEDADSVPVDRTQFGNILPSDDSDLKTAQDAFEFVDELPLQVADTYDLAFEGAPNGIDDNNTWVIRRLPLERLITIRNARPQQPFIGKSRYTAAYITGSATPGSDEEVDYTHRIWSNLSTSATTTSQIDAEAYLFNEDRTNQTSAGTTRTTEISIPNDCMEIAVGFKSNTGQNDARLLITNYDFDVELGIDSSGFDGNLTDNVRSTQSLAQAVDDLTISGGGATTAANVSIDNTRFGDPARLPGGIAENTGITGVPVNPTNVQQFAEKTDTLLQLVDDPFQSNQALDWGGSFAESGTVSSGTPLLSNPIDIPQELRDLGVDVTIRMRIRIHSITNNFRGNFRLVNAANTTEYGDPEISNGGGVGARSAGDFVTFQRTIIASQVPNTFRLRYTRTSSAGSSEINRSVAYMLDRTTDTVGQMGQSGSYNETIIWIAGGTANARYTGTNVDQTLLAGHTWAQYDDLQFNFDTTAAGLIIKPLRITSNSFLSTEGSSYGVLEHTDLYAIMVRPTGANTFRVLWNGGGSIGLRRILGISTT